MKLILVSVLLLISSHSFARSIDFLNTGSTTVEEVSLIFDSSNILDISAEPDLVAKEERVGLCMQEYIIKQKKSYDRETKSTLYDLMNNFASIMKRVYGKKGNPDDIPLEEKIEALARVECETYYALGVLK